MLQFIITTILMISLGTIFYIVARSLPRIKEEEAEPRKQTFLDRLIMSEIPHKVDTAINTFSGKLCRKLKVSLLKFDNCLSKQLKRLNAEGNGNGKPKIDFSELSSDKEEKNTVADNEKKE